MNTFFGEYGLVSLTFVVVATAIILVIFLTTNYRSFSRNFINGITCTANVDAAVADLQAKGCWVSD